MVLFTTGMAVVLGYAVLRSGRVLAAYLHALVDQIIELPLGDRFQAAQLRSSTSTIGIYGILTLADRRFLYPAQPDLKGKGSSLYRPEAVELADEQAAA